MAEDCNKCMNVRVVNEDESCDKALCVKVCNLTQEVREDGASEQLVPSEKAVSDALSNYAKTDGYYQGMTVGTAENLVGRGSVPASFTRRTTGGTADVGTGSAKITKLGGNSVVFNQLVNPDGGSHSGATFDAETGIWTINKTVAANDRAFLTFNAESINIQGHTIIVSMIKVSGTIDNTVSFYFGASTDKATANTPVARFVSNTPNATITLLLDNSASSTPTTYTFTCRLFAIDLTKMFGAGNEPATVAEFRALYPLDYYAYNTGEVLPFAAENLETTGFNQWDGDFSEENAFLTTSGTTSANQYFSISSYIKVFPSTKYFINHVYGDSPAVVFYDADKNFISGVAHSSGTNGIEITTPANCYYIRDSINKSYANNICINLSWSGYRNGEYEPYRKDTKAVNPAAWLDTDGNLVYPYGGMHGVGTARDFATPDADGYIRKATRVFARVDLGTLNWNYRNDGVFTLSTSSQRVFKTNNIICAKYVTTSASDVAGMPDKSIMAKTLYNDDDLLVKDSSAGTDGSAFKAAMSGIYLYYELATPVEVTLATPIAATYVENDFGTEEWVPANDATPYTAPCYYEVQYPMNAVDTLRRLPENYISKDSMDAFLTALQTAGVISAYTMTYDSVNQEYNFSITQ